MEKLVSVVIPVYNVEKYLKECLDSVINQTYKNLQIIIVDDGSTDSSGEICDEYARKDNRITVVHQKNAGAGAAKNTGLNLVKGEYVSLIDSDDYIESDMYENMVKCIEKERADVVQCLFSNTYLNYKERRDFRFKQKEKRILTQHRFLYELLFDWKYAIFCNKLFRASLIKDIRFPEGRKIDDEFFTYKIICNAKKIININYAFYNYRMRKSSVMNCNNNDRFILDRIECFKERYDYVSDKYPRLNKYFYEHFSNYLLYESNCIQEEKIKRIVNQYISQFPVKKANIMYIVKSKIKLLNYRNQNDTITNNNKEYFE